MTSLPKTAVVFYMSGIDFIKEHTAIELISEHFPRFLNSCPIFKPMGNDDLCFLDGGRGAPMAADTIEVLKALGVENIISAGLMGGFTDCLSIGDIVIPNKAYVEEGTSLHYYEAIEYSRPDPELLELAVSHIPDSELAAIVSTDAIYRQTFFKEQVWRNKGCVGVDMETSALLSIGRYLNMRVISVLMVSDIHPMKDKQEQWEWHMNNDLRKKLLRQIFEIALSI